jgi:hypothetical protein
MTSIQSQSDIAKDLDKDEYFYALKKRIYFASKEGFSLNLALFLNKIESADVRSILVNQVSFHFN